MKSVELLNNIGFKIENIHLKDGIKYIVKNTSFQGRWQVLQKEPMMICDTAHNEAALKEVISQLNNFDNSNLNFIIGFSNDKNLENISKIFPETSKYYFVQSKVGRARNAKEVRDIFKSNNRNGDYFESIKETINYVRGICNKNDVIFIGGSTFVVSEIFDKF